MGIVGKILVYGDIHLSSKNYGAHRDYPSETLNILKLITNKAKEVQATHIIGLGDLAYGRFNTLEYRESVEHELEEQYSICNGNRYELKGNHDSAGYGMTEYEYYIRKGLLKAATNITLGRLSITMVDYGQHKNYVPNIKPENINIVLAHDFFTFKDAQMPNFGKAIELDNFTQWYGVDHIVCGHIHTSGLYEGLIVRSVDGQSYGHRTTLDYLGSMSRPAYQEGNTDLEGHILIITIEDDGNMTYDRQDIELLPIEEAFNLDIKQAQKEKEIAKRKRVDISDIVNQLDKHERNIGNPEDIIMSLNGVDERYKVKAIELLKMGQA